MNSPSTAWHFELFARHGLCADGAEKARGEYLIFTEAHCRPEPDALEKCLEAIRENPEGGILVPVDTDHPQPPVSSRSRHVHGGYRARHAFSSMAEILDHCFVTRREAYEACGGCRPEFGHFAEWVLAANFFQLGYKLGYFPKARFHHYYIGTVRELRTFTHDLHTPGEVRSIYSELPNPSHGLLRCPPEWICQGNFDRRTARTNFNIAVKNLWPPGARYKYLIPSIAQIGRWNSSCNLGRPDRPRLRYGYGVAHTDCIVACQRDRFPELAQCTFQENT